MKLSSARIQDAVEQTGAHAIPDDHPAVSQLKGIFGDHTFFLNRDGLNIVETDEPAGDGVVANVVNIANWADAEGTALVPHQPELTGAVVELGPEDPDNVA